MLKVKLPFIARYTVGAIFLVVAHAAFAAAPLGFPHVARRIETRAPLRIVAFGSSSTEGIGATSKERSYPSRLQAMLTGLLPNSVAATVLNRGVGGDDVDDMVRRLPAIIAEKPDLVIWQTGSNDPLRGVAVEHFIAATRDGIERMRAAGIDVMLMEPQMCDRLARTVGADAFRDAVRDLGRQMHVPVVRRYDLMRQWLASGSLTASKMMSGDGLHMTDGGYENLANAVAETILAASRTGPGDVVAK